MTTSKQAVKLSGIDKTFIVLTLVSDAMFGAERGLALHGASEAWKTWTLAGHAVGQAMFGLLVGATLINAINALSAQPKHKGLWFMTSVTVFTVIVSTVEAVHVGQYSLFGVGCAVLAPYVSAIALTLASNVKGRGVIDDMVAVVRDELAKIKAELQAKTNELAKTASTLQAKDGEIDRLRKEIAGLSSQLDSNGNQYAIINAKDREISTLAASVDRLKDAAKNTLAKHSAELQAKDSEIANLKTTLQAKIDEMQRVNSEVNPLAGELQAKSGEVANLSILVATLRDEVAELSKPIDQRIAEMAANGMSAQAIAAKVGLSRQAVDMKIKAAK